MYTFNITDHLGNVRAVVNQDGRVLETNDYYPYGMLMNGGATSVQPFKYCGKELDRMHGLNWYDHGARMSAPALCRWHVVDPLCEKYYDMSPYSYCLGDPVNCIDPDGQDVFIWYVDSNGKDRCFRFNGRVASDGRYHIPNNEFVRDFVTAYVYDTKNGGGDNLKKAVTDSKYKIHVQATKREGGSHCTYTEYNNQMTVFWNSREGLETTEGGLISPATILEHEFAHAVKHTNSILNKDGKYEKDRNTPTYDDYDNVIERDIITGAERKTAICNKESIRNNHRSKRLYTTIKSTSTIRKKR